VGVAEARLHVLNGLSAQAHGRGERMPETGSTSTLSASYRPISPTVSGRRSASIALPARSNAPVLPVHDQPAERKTAAGQCHGDTWVFAELTDRNAVLYRKERHPRVPHIGPMW
jgi:hypothetical protein